LNQNTIGIRKEMIRRDRPLILAKTEEREREIGDEMGCWGMEVKIDQ